MNLLNRFKRTFCGGLKVVGATVRSKAQIISELEELDSNAPDYCDRAWKLFDECSVWLRKDREKLSLMLKFPCRPKFKWSDDDLIDMASVVETMRLAAMVAVVAVLNPGHHKTLEMVISQLGYQADFLRYIGYNECDFPIAFRWGSPEVAAAVIQEWKSAGMTRQEMYAKATEGFEDLAQIVKRPVLNKFGISKSCEDMFWQYIPQAIRGAAKRLFDEGHYSESVESACKEINSQVKAEYLKRTGQEADGVDLMRKAFSTNMPIIELSRSENSETRRNEQLGYMELFVGAMSALRNPKAHANVPLGKEDAVRQLMLSGLLLSRFELFAHAGGSSKQT